MAKSGPIVVVEDDKDDQEIIREVLKDLRVPNKLVLFEKSRAALQYLKTTSDQPFIIICDVNLPQENGLEFKHLIDSDPDLRRRSIPFIFFSTSVSQNSVNIAYTKMTVQGFFQKAGTYDEVKNLLKVILGYWSDCKHPNT